ncbi:MAG: oxygen-independent coproporphyrinogen III oxidase [Bacteroidia bacterium]|nr:oxygen-independent coproporphyrinogen III oxidase [Bacteroidia bacterium]
MNLISKYNVAAPRYTSYPTVPYWQQAPTQQQWNQLVKECFELSNHTNGISLYIHLPYCESLCTYCACNTRITVNHKVEEPYINSLLKEWQLYLSAFNEKPRLKEIHLGGGTPTFFSAANLTKLLEGIYKTAEICEDAEFSFEAHPNNTTEEHLKALYDLGFRRVSFGIQDFDPKVQDVINRLQSFEQVFKVVEQSRKIGYTSINFDLVYGLPFQTLNSVRDTIEKVNELKPDRIAFYSYAHVPWLKPGQRKFTEKDLPEDVEKRKLYELGLELFQQNNYKAIGMDHFALANDSLFEALQQKSLHRNFMGYTHNYTQLLIGLGASSISDTWNGFAQNLKTVEEYQAAVEKNEFPIFKGHVLSSEDLILRKHILNIMCQGKTTWNKENEQCEALYKGLEKMKALEADGLVNILPHEITVTEIGQSFLRNICMCLDARYWEKTPQASLFSSAV